MSKYYHSARRKKGWFEGWYIKLQTNDGKALALIPAIHADKEGLPRASLQVISAEGAWWLDYPAEDFLALENHFYIRVGPNIFSSEGVWLDIDREGLSLHGRLAFGQFIQPRSDIMGPFRFVPGMECCHGVISLWHSLSGQLSLNGRVLDFSRGMGYIETDRGRSFPSRYLWAQCSWREPSPGCVMLSVAKIPMAGRSFTGCIGSVLCGGREYRLATYLGAKAKEWSAEGAVITQGKYRLEIIAPGHSAQALRAPVNGDMCRTIHESLYCPLRCRFHDDNRLIFSFTGRCAGFEHAGGE